MGKGVVYSIRRYMQVLAYSVASPEFMSRIYTMLVLKRKLNLNCPETFNDKLQYLKLKYWPNCEEAIICVDKYKVREYLENRGFGEYVNEIYGAYDCGEDIDFGKLPEKFVLKCNHGCGYNIIVNDKSKLNIKETVKKLNKWLKEDFAKYNAEPHYSKIKPKIICEKHLGDVVNYNIFCCNGKPTFFSVIEGLGAGVDEALTYYWADGRKAEFQSLAYPTSDKPLPQVLDKMKELAQEVAKDFPFIRVDFFEVDGKIIFSELTFTPGGALIPFNPPEYDKILGEKLDISHILK